jgi:hypothetical protein
VPREGKETAGQRREVAIQVDEPASGGSHPETGLHETVVSGLHASPFASTTPDR